MRKLLIKPISMFAPKSKNVDSFETPVSTSASIISAGTTLEGDMISSGDIRIDGTLNGNIQCSAKVIIGENGSVKGDLTGSQADIMGKVTGSIKVKELLQLKGGCQVNGNIAAGKLHIEATAKFNGQCQMEQPVVGLAEEILPKGKVRIA